MKEFFLDIKHENLAQGLRQEITEQLNTLKLARCVNMKPDKIGLVPYLPITIPFSIETLVANNIELDWPFPQLMRGRNITLLATQNRIFEVDEIDWSLHQITTYNAASEASELGIPEGGHAWSFVDLGQSFFLFNGKCAVFRVNKEAMFGGVEKCFVATNCRIECGCDFKGRLLMGGFDRDHAWSSDWQSFIEGYANNSGLSFDFTLAMKENFVWWSSIGGGDLTWMFQQDWSETGFITAARGASEAPYSSARPIIFDILKRNEMGFMPMRWRGMVRAMKQLGDLVIVYGDNGVSALRPANFGVGSGFGSIEIAPFGIANNGAVAGDEREHIFIDRSGKVWRLKQDLSVERLDYSEFIGPLVGGDVIVSFEPARREFFIGNGEETFVLTNSGLGATRQLVSSVVWADGESVGIGTMMDSEDQTAYITTGRIDFGMRGIKTITQVEVGGEFGSDGYVMVQYAYDKGAVLSNGDWVLLNKEGFTKVYVSGIEFQIALKFSEYDKVHIDYIRIYYQVSDKRYIRSQYAG